SRPDRRDRRRAAPHQRAVAGERAEDVPTRSHGDDRRHRQRGAVSRIGGGIVCERRHPRRRRGPVAAIGADSRGRMTRTGGFRMDLWRRSVVAVAGVLAIWEGRAIAQNGSQFRDWNASAVADQAQLQPRAACAALVALTGYELSITAAEVVPASN